MNDRAAQMVAEHPAAPKSAKDYRFVVLINGGSGSADFIAIKQRLTAAHCALRIVNFVALHDVSTIEDKVEKAFIHAKNNRLAVLVVGGDGSICLAVKYALLFDVPLALLAQGTFNLFALHHGLAVDTEKGIAQIENSHIEKVAVARINDLPFITGANFGLYPELIEQREKYQSLTGVRTRITAYISGLHTFLFKRKKLKLKMTTPDSSFDVSAQIIMLSQNRPHIENLGLASDHWLKMLNNQLLMIVAKPETFLDKLRMMGHRLLGKLEDDLQFEVKPVSEVVIETRRRKLKVALDGEIYELTTPLNVKVEPNALALFKTTVDQ